MSTAEATRQISAHISAATKRELESFADSRGLKMGYVIEDALLHHFQALKQLPEDVVVPARLVVSPASFGRVAAALARPRKPTAALKKMMASPRRG